MAICTLHFLGVRGSVPVEGTAFSIYGGATACILLRMGGEVFVLDCGSGMGKLPQALAPEEKKIHVFISHPHVDHLMGMPMCPIFFSSAFESTIWGKAREGRSVLAQVSRLMSPPLWPVTPEAFSAKTRFQELPTAPFFIGEVKIETMDGNHPGGCTVYRFTHGETSVVYATDYEITKQSATALEDFAKNATLLLCDGQYTYRELPQKSGFGHSTWEDATLLGKAAQVKRLSIVHHAPYRTDDALNQGEREMQQQFAPCSFAKSGEEIIL